MDKRAKKVHCKSNPSKSGTKHLEDSLSASEAALKEQRALLADVQNESAEIQKKNEAWQTELKDKFNAKIESVDAALNAQHQLEGPAKLWQEKEGEHKAQMQSSYRYFICISSDFIWHRPHFSELNWERHAHW